MLSEQHNKPLNRTLRVLAAFQVIEKFIAQVVTHIVFLAPVSSIVIWTVGPPADC
jgi:hypothetical protein